MEILGIGVPELAFIVLIALILLGPKDMIAAGRTIGKLLRKVLTSPTWLALRRTGEELQQLPTKLVREAGLDELQELQKEVQKDIRGVTNQIKPMEITKAFDEARIFDPSTKLVIPDNPASPENGAGAKPAAANNQELPTPSKPEE